MACCEDNKCVFGPDCPARQACELPITMEDNQPLSFDDIATMVRDLFALIGFVLMLAIIAFAWVYAA
jgi:hypothetical protein